MNRALAAVRQMRADRDAARVRQDGIAGALLQVIGDGPVDRYCRMLPEDDPHGDRVEDLETLAVELCRREGPRCSSSRRGTPCRGDSARQGRPHTVLLCPISMTKIPRSASPSAMMTRHSPTRRA